MHIPMLNVVIPANVILINKIMLPLVMFDILADLEILQSIFPESEADAEQYMSDYSQLNDIGYESFNILMNLGTLAFLAVMYIIKLLSLVILGPIAYFSKAKFFKDLY
jgi:hypothetical protein